MFIDIFVLIVLIEFVVFPTDSDEHVSEFHKVLRIVYNHGVSISCVV